jgi:hypothetical protein
MKCLAYLLVLVLLSAQVDDAWAVTLDLPSAPLAVDDDEYLPSQQRPQEEESSPWHKPVLVGRKHPTAAFPLVRRSVPSEWNPTPPCAPPSLYVFMSLQI